ncbi:oxidoreductase [Actinomadura sp. NBRC 104425]|uniref:aldo/keto reductase n=1 Tax=Actinomadura sp. NBRC 104425 TaxID=3032204 RepID=UPI0024A4DDDF|nr:aldo/keto reductase [Actinomadura sp. NBRC 104425]GLZ11004.1 oxidoreductase [Actinomadura sp. NBRC 104425]
MEFALGAMWFGTRVDEETSFAILDRFVEAGGTMIDTADNYAFWLDGGRGGESETVIGRWLASRKVRDQVFIGTKVGAQPKTPGTGLENAEGLSEKAIRSAAEGSLRRLGTDHIDLYWAHIEDRSVPLEETMGAFRDLVREGAVGRVGVSNHAVWRVERARALGEPRYDDLQYRYSYLLPQPGVKLPDNGHHHADEELLDYVRAEGLRLWVYNALLSGSYTRPDKPLHRAYEHPSNKRRLAALKSVADELGATPNQVVLAWLMGGDPPMIPIVGVSAMEHLEEALGAADLALDAELRERLDTAASA